MLRTILTAIRDAGRPLCLADLSRELGVDEATLEGMLETLRARGRLCVVDADEDGCATCPLKGGCFVMHGGVARTYRLP